MKTYLKCITNYFRLKHHSTTITDQNGLHEKIESWSKRLAFDGALEHQTSRLANVHKNLGNTCCNMIPKAFAHCDNDTLKKTQVNSLKFSIHMIMQSLKSIVFLFRSSDLDSIIGYTEQFWALSYSTQIFNKLNNQ